MSVPKERHYLEAELYRRLSDEPELLGFVLQSTLDGLWYWDLENPENTWMSPEYWTSLGFDPAIRRHHSSEWQDLIHPGDLDRTTANMRRHCDDPSHPYDLYVRFRHADGSWVTVRCRGMAIRDAGGKATRMVGAHTNVTDVVSANNRNEALLCELESRNEDLLAFAYAASHDLRSPLNSLKGLFMLLKEDVPEVTGLANREIVERIDSTMDRMQILIDSVLKIAGVSQAEVHRKTCDMDELMAEIISDREGALTECHGRLTHNVLGNARIDRSLATHALGNLVDNALKFRSKERDLVIEVRAEQREHDYVVHVIDNGSGFDPHELEHAFDFFARRRSAINAQSNGLGLAIVRKVAELHEGGVEAEALAEGSRVSIRFGNAL